MNYQFARHLLLRMPVRTPADYTGSLQSFLNDQFFRSALYLASPVFFSILESRNFQAGHLSLKETLTLQKYINRFCYRPTPFGLFASISLVTWSNIATDLHGSHKFIPYISAAMPYQHAVINYLIDHALITRLNYQRNPSVYRVLNEYRFFRTGLNENGRQREYQLQSIAFSKVLKDVLSLGNTPCSKEEIIYQIIQSAGCDQKEALDYADFLIDAQILINKESMTITGIDHLQLISGKVQPGPVKRHLLYLIDRLNNNKKDISPELIKKLNDDQKHLLPAGNLPDDLINIILKRETGEETLALNWQDSLRDGIYALELLSTGGQSGILKHFKDSFQQHFEGQMLPLLQALDPEAGVGYQQPETEKSNPLLETVIIPYRNPGRENNNWSPIHSLLMEAWLRERSANTVIELQDADLDRLITNENTDQLLGMSILFRLTGNKIFIENAGGNNAPSLMGRFTAADPGIANSAREMASQLEEQNPEIIFAEILHLADLHTDNVNRRAQIYRYELPVTAVSSLPIEQQIRLSDLYVTVIDNKVMLFSKQHQKYVIPRLTSAYNHSVNKLPLFRFLADLSYQHARSNLGLDLRRLFPGLSFYPRVTYKNTILYLATWIISAAQAADLLANDLSGVETFRKFSENIQLSRFFSLTEGDQELVFDGLSDRDVNFFCNCIRKKDEVVLKEFLEQDEVKQYNAYLLPNGPIKLPQPFKQSISTIKKKRKYMPGSSWLYLKIYAPKIGINRMLTRLAPLLHKVYAGQRIEEWFFIRYEDHAPHIRLRLKLNPEIINEILLSFKAKLEDRIQQHVIREFQIDVYRRELERYAAGGIEQTESHFWASSELVISFLRKGKVLHKSSTHAFALYSTYIMISTFIAAPDEQINFTLASFQLFLPEFADKSIKVELDKKYRELSADIMATFQSRDQTILSGSSKSARNFEASLKVIRNQMTEEPSFDYLRSIIHMHLNRIFTDEARKQEMIFYYLLHKYLLSVKGRLKRIN